MKLPRAVDLLRKPLPLRPYQVAAWAALLSHFEDYLVGGVPTFGYEAPMGSGKTTVVKAVSAELLADETARLVVVAAPLDAIVSQWSRIGSWRTEPGQCLVTPPRWQGHADAPRATAAQLRDPAWWATARGFYVTTRQAMCTAAATDALRSSGVNLRGVLVVGDEGHHHGDGTRAGEFFRVLRERGAATLLVSGTPWHGMGSVFTPETRVVRQSAAALASCVDPDTGRPYAPPLWRVERHVVAALQTNRADLAIEPDSGAEGSWRPRQIATMCRAVAEHWARIGCPRTVINVPGAKEWKDALLAALRCVAPAVLNRAPSVVDLIGDMSDAARTAAQARLVADGATPTYDHSGRVDVVISCARMDEGTDWPPCSHVFNVRIPCSPLRILQRWARASRGKWKIADYPAEWAESQTLVFFVPTLTGEAVETAWRQHREQAVLLAAYLADYEAAARWVDPRCFAAADATWRRAAGRKTPKGTRLGRPPATGDGDGDRRGGSALERSRAVAAIVERIQRRGPDGTAKIADLDAELARSLPDVSSSARKAALLSLARGEGVMAAVDAARARADQAVAQGKSVLRVREELQAELDRIVAEFAHFEIAVPEDWNARVARFTALDAQEVAERVRTSKVPPWHDIRDDREALEAFTREAARVRGNRPTANSGACESLGGWTYRALDWALKQAGTSLADALGRALTPSEKSAREIRQWYNRHERWPRQTSEDPSEAKLGKAISNVRRLNPECLKNEGVPERLDRSAALRKMLGKSQFKSAAEVIVPLSREWRSTQITQNELNHCLKNASTRSTKSRGLAYAPDLCQISSIATANAEIEADCWRFTLASEAAPDPRPWAELLASGDHRQIVSAERLAFLDWKDSRLRDGTRWTDPRTGGGSKCPPAVRRPWTPPAPSDGT